MKKVLFFLLVVMLSLPLTMRAQDEIIIGTGTSTSSHPFYGLYANSWCEVVYPASEITTTGLITDLAWNCSSVNQQTYTTLKIYLGTKSASTYSSSSDWTPLSDLTLVYDGTNEVVGAATGWQTFTLDTPFPYDGSENLVVVVAKTMPSYSSTYYYYTSVSNTCLYRGNDSDVSYATHPGSASGNMSSYMSNITITISPLAGVCQKPKNLTVSSVDDASASLVWLDTTATSWDVYYTEIETDVPDSNTVPTATVTTTNYDISGLTSSTHYYAYVRSDCGGGEKSGWRSVSFMTSQIAAQLPYTQDFEDATENANWTIVGTQTNQWFIGTAVSASDSASLYITDDNGVSNNYSHSASTAWAYRDIDFGSNYAEYALSFSWRNQGESSYYDYLKVYIGQPAEPAASASSSGATPAGATLLGTYYGSSNWNTAQFTLPSTYTGVQRLYFLWWNDGSVGSNPPAAVDNISVTGSNCGRPQAVVLDGTTPSSIAFHFVPALETDYAWQAVVVPADSVIDPTMAVDLSDTMHVFTDLLANTAYSIFVRTDCGGEYSNWSDVLSVRTDCNEYTLPYTENFDSFTAGSGNQPTCWYFTNSSYPYVSSSYSTSPSNSLYFSYNGSAYCAAMPAVPLTDSLGDNINLSDLRLRFNARHTSASYTITVGVMTDPSDLSTYTALQTINPGSNTSSFEPQEVFFTNYTGIGRYIAFQGNSSYMYIDDIVLDYAPSCGEVTDLEVSSIAGTSAMLTWQDGAVGTTVGYDVEYTEYGQENWVSAGTGITNTYLFKFRMLISPHFL